MLTGEAAVIVADEAHVIKNSKGNLFRAMMHLKSRKRVALTGYPLQNRLMEYYTMIEWVLGSSNEDNFLGGVEDFQQQFVAPVERGAPAKLLSRVDLQRRMTANHNGTLKLDQILRLVYWVVTPDHLLDEILATW